MYCAHLKKEIESKECPPMITAIRSSEALRVCQECPHGIVLASCAKVVSNYYQPEEEQIMEEVMPEVPAEYNAPKEQRISEEVTISPVAPTSITMPELAKLAGVKVYSVQRIRRGLDQTGRNAQIVNEKLCELGLTWADVKKIPHGERGQRNASQKAALAHNLEKTVTEITQAIEPEVSAQKHEAASDDEYKEIPGMEDFFRRALDDAETKAQQNMSLKQVLNALKSLLPYGAKVRIEF